MPYIRWFKHFAFWISRFTSYILLRRWISPTAQLRSCVLKTFLVVAFRPCASQLVWGLGRVGIGRPRLVRHILFQCCRRKSRRTCSGLKMPWRYFLSSNGRPRWGTSLKWVLLLHFVPGRRKDSRLRIIALFVPSGNDASTWLCAERDKQDFR